MHSQHATQDSDSDSDSLIHIDKYLTPPSKTISAGDIVWAKYRNLYWPALVRTCYPNEKKISIWYCDEPGKTFKLPLKNVCLFHDPKMRTKILNDVKEAGCLKEHEGLTSHAFRYLNRRAKNIKDDPMKFFDQTYPFFLVEEMLKKDPDADVSDIKIPPLYISDEKKRTIRKELSADNSESSDSEVESVDSDSELRENTPYDYVSKINKHLSKKLSQENISSNPLKEIDDKIVEYILSGSTDDYLRKIKLKNLPSEHRDLFEKYVENNKKNTDELTFTGPIEDHAKLRKIIFYLLPLHEKMGNELRSRSFSPQKTKKVNVSSPFCDRNIGAQYVASVWLPESIMFAISKIKNVSLSKAKQLFTEVSESKTKEIEKLLTCIDPLFEDESPSNAPEIVQTNVIPNKKQSTFNKSPLKRCAATSLSCQMKKKCCLDKDDTVYSDKEILYTDLKSQNSKLGEMNSLKVNSSEDEYVNKILNYILSDKGNDYLKNIKLKCMPSDHLNVYEASKCEKKKLSDRIYTGPVKDDDKVMKLICFLLSLYDDDDNSHKIERSAAKKCKRSMSVYYKNKKDHILYVIYVWLPESIIFAISEINNVPLSEAKMLFDKYATAKSVCDIIKSLNENFQTDC